MLAGLLAAGQFDAAYVHLFRMAPYLQEEKALYRILDLTDLISLEVQSSLPFQSALWRSIYRIEGPRIADYERRSASAYDEVWFISARDRRLFTAAGVSANTQVVSNGTAGAYLQQDRVPVSRNRLLFLGNLRVKHNVDALVYLVQDIFPLILEGAPDCELEIVGAGENAALKRLESRPNVHVRGYVADLAPVFAASAVAVAPLRFSAGVQNKVVEAMAAGLPVVTSGNVAAGLGADSAGDLLVADDAPSFAAAVLQLLNDKELRRRLGTSGRLFVERNHASKTAVDRLRQIEKRRP